MSIQMNVGNALGNQYIMLFSFCQAILFYTCLQLIRNRKTPSKVPIHECEVPSVRLMAGCQCIPARIDLNKQSHD